MNQHTRYALLKLDIVASNHGHPDERRRSQRKGKDLRKTKGHALKHKQLAGKMAQRHHVRPDGNIVHRTAVQVVRRIASNDGSDDCPRSKQPSGEGRQLVRSLGVVLGMDQLVGRVFGVEVGGRGGQPGVSDEAAVVNAP